MPRYAAETTVSAEQSRAEIERTLTRYGATAFAYGWENNRALIQFQMHNRRIRFVLTMPDPRSREFTHTPARGQLRTPQAAREAYDQATRQRWRALALVIKAKLEAVEAGIADFESEFLANVLLPTGQTVGEYTIPQIETAYSTGRMPPMLPMLGRDE